MTSAIDASKRVLCFGINVRGQFGGIDPIHRRRQSGHATLRDPHRDLGIVRRSGCRAYLFPPFHPTFSGSTVDETSNDVGDDNDMQLLSDGCPVVLRRPREQRRQGRDLRNGLWTVETPIPDTTSVLSTSVAVDNDDRVHVIATDPSYDASSQDIVFSTKVAGRWVSLQLPVRKCQPRRHALDSRWPRGHLVHWLQGHLDGVPVIVSPGLAVVRGLRSVLLRHQPGDTYNEITDSVHVAFTISTMSGDVLRYLRPRRPASRRRW